MSNVIIDLTAQLERMETKGFQKDEVQNILKGYKDATGELLEEAVEANRNSDNPKDIELITPLMALKAEWNSQSEVTSITDGSTVTIPGHYTITPAIPAYYMDIVNKGIDMAKIPSMKELEQLKIA